MSRPRLRHALELACVALPLAAASPVRAQASDDVAAAEALFKEARELVEAGNFREGCPKFEAALALHPSASTQLNIAKCREEEGRIASAWAEYKRALVLNRETQGPERQKKLEEIALAGIAALEPKLPRLRVVVAERPPGLELVRDGRALPLASLGEALALDPGEHTIEARAPGFRSLSRAVRLEPGKTTTLELALQPEPRSAPAIRPAPRPLAPKRPDAGEEAGGVPTWAWVAGGTGVVLTGAGIYFLIDDLNAISRLRERCSEAGGRTTCEPGYDYESDNARKDRGFALFLGLTGAGAAAIAASIVGIASAPKARAALPVPWITAHGAGLGITGEL